MSKAEQAKMIEALEEKLKATEETLHQQQENLTALTTNKEQSEAANILAEAV